MVAALTLVVAPGVAYADADEDTVIIDLRRGDSALLHKSQTALRFGLGRVQGVAVLSGAAMDAALRGEQDAPLVRRGKTTLTAAAIAYGRLDCKAATRAARLASINYAALEAKAVNVRDSLRRAHVYLLLCSHPTADTNADARARAADAVTRLRALGFTTAPTGVSEAIWNKYLPTIPVPGAITLAMAEVHISHPVGATVWIDHVARGKAPLTVKLSVGEHLVAVSTAAGAAARLTTVKTGRTSISMTIPVTSGALAPIRRTIAGWKTAGRIISTKRLAAIMRQLNVRFALVMLGSQVSVWGVQKYRKVARRLGTETATKPVALAALVADHASAWDGRGPDPSLPLLTETNTKKLEKKPQKWWVYASIIGAVAMGAAIIIANDSADDNQRILLTHQ